MGNKLNTSAAGDQMIEFVEMNWQSFLQHCKDIGLKMTEKEISEALEEMREVMNRA